MKKEIDCRKMDCQSPMLETKKCLEQEALSQIRVIVDNDAAVENLSRFLIDNGFEVGVDSNGIFSAVEGNRNEVDAKKLESSPAQNSGHTRENALDRAHKTMVLISAEALGKGDDDLGRKLMVNFIKTLKEMGTELWDLVLVNHGVKFATDDSAVIEDLKDFENGGTNILVCGTSLTYLGLMDKKVVGQTTNMLDIVTAMQYANKVINL